MKKIFIFKFSFKYYPTCNSTVTAILNVYIFIIAVLQFNFVTKYFCYDTVISFVTVFL